MSAGLGTNSGLDVINVRERTLKFLSNKPQATRRDTPGTDESLPAASMSVQDRQGVQPPQAIIRDNHASWCMETGTSDAQTWVPLTSLRTGNKNDEGVFGMLCLIT